MLFGLINALASFQEYINKIFAKKLEIFVFLYLDDILIFTDDDGDGHVAAVQWVLEQLRKFLLFANLKKCRFHQEKVWFLGYMMSSKDIRMKDKKIKAIKQWPELRSVQNIQVFLRFANFYQQFILGFSWIAVLLTSILKILGSTESKTHPGEGKVGVGGNRAGHDRNKQDGSGLDGDKLHGCEFEGNEVEKKVPKRSKFKNLSKSTLDFLTPGAKLVCIKLR